MEQELGNKKLNTAEKITLTHFFLMFGYKLFSFYFPLYLLEKNFSILQVGYTSFLIYISLAISAPVVGYLNYKIKPNILITLGVLGYSGYSLAMLFSVPVPYFYGFQILLGISGALFFVSSRSILMSEKSKKLSGTFAWFYSAPIYADAIAPALGALIIWKFGFFGVFVVALIVQVLASIFAFTKLKSGTKVADKVSLSESISNYKKVSTRMDTKGVFIIFLSFLILVIAGFNNTFFILFLKSLNLTQEQILIFNSVVSLSFLPISIVVAKKINKVSNEKNIYIGGQIVGAFSILLGLVTNFINYFLMFVITLIEDTGNLIASSGRSSLMATRLKNYPKESAAIDTIFSPLSTSFGALFGGILIYYFGYQLIFIFMGVVILLLSLIGIYVKNRKN